MTVREGERSRGTVVRQGYTYEPIEPLAATDDRSADPSNPPLPMSFRSPLAAILCALAVTCGARTVHAQDRLDPVSMGTARSSVATVRGIATVASNPGALALPDIGGVEVNRGLTFSVYNAGGTIGSTYLNTSRYQNLFAPGEDYRGDLAGEVLRQKRRLLANGGVNLLTVRYHTEHAGTFALHYGQRVHAEINFPERLAYTLATLNLASEDFRFSNDSGIGGTWTSELGLSYGTSYGDRSTGGWFPLVGVGLTAKLVQGIVHFAVDDNSIVSITQTSLGSKGIGFVVTGGYRFRTAEPEGFDPNNAVGTLLSGLPTATAGLGYGLTLGASGVLYRTANGTDAAYFGVVVQDLGRVTWDGVTTVRTARDIRDTIINASLTDQQLESYAGTVERVADFTTALPSTVRAGIGLNLNSLLPDISARVLLGVEGEFALNREPGQARDPRLGIGGQWAPNDAFALRTGIGWGGATTFGVGLGFGWKPLDWLALDVGTSELDAIIEGERLDLAVRLTLGVDTGG